MSRLSCPPTGVHPVFRWYGPGCHSPAVGGKLTVVSRRFDAMEEAAKQDLLWKIIDTTDLTDDEKRLISLVMPVSPAEIK